jgi:hypothetical protein
VPELRRRAAAALVGLPNLPPLRVGAMTDLDALEKLALAGPPDALVIEAHVALAMIRELHAAREVVEAARSELANNAVSVVGNTVYLGTRWVALPGQVDALGALFLDEARANGLAGIRDALAAYDRAIDGKAAERTLAAWEKVAADRAKEGA